MTIRCGVIKIFEPKGPPLGSEGVVDSVKGFPSPALVILQNVVALFHTMLVYVGLICQMYGSWAYLESQEIWGHWGPRHLFAAHASSLKCLFPGSYHTELQPKSQRDSFT